MNKVEMIKAVANELKITQKETKAVVDAVFNVIADQMVAGEKVSIAGFGAFEARERAGRMGRNPYTGEDLEIPASRSPKFKASSTLKKAVKGA